MSKFVNYVAVVLVLGGLTSAALVATAETGDPSHSPRHEAGQGK